MPSAQVVLPGEPQSARAARRFLTERLTAWHAEDLEPTAVLLLSELVANAALHARTVIIVRASRTPDLLRLEVTDESPRLPVRRHFSIEASTGRGLGLVARLASSWGVESEPGGKTVWCELVERDEHLTEDPDLDVWADVGERSADLAGRPGR